MYGHSIDDISAWVGFMFSQKEYVNEASMNSSKFFPSDNQMIDNWWLMIGNIFQKRSKRQKPVGHPLPQSVIECGVLIQNTGKDIFVLFCALSDDPLLSRTNQTSSSSSLSSASSSSSKHRRWAWRSHPKYWEGFFCSFDTMSESFLFSTCWFYFLYHVNMFLSTSK